MLSSFPQWSHDNILWKAEVYFLNWLRIVNKLVETSQASVSENTDDNVAWRHIDAMMQQDINDIGNSSFRLTTSEKFASSAYKLPVAQKYHLIKSHFASPIKY